MIVGFTQTSINLRPSSDTGGVHQLSHCHLHQVCEREFATFEHEPPTNMETPGLFEGWKLLETTMSETSTQEVDDTSID